MPNPTIFLYQNEKPDTMAQDKTRMPMSTAGITTYFDDYHSKIEFKPGHIITFAVVVMLIVVAMHIWGSSFLGLA